MNCPRPLFVLTLSLLLPGAFAQAPGPMTTIASLDVPRYLGRWYEIAKFPNSFQKKCASDTSADYALLPDGKLTVLNQCRRSDGQWDTAQGLARPAEGAQAARFQVRFAPAWLSFLPQVWGDYWIVDLDEGYELAAVSEPRREYLWVLSRSPSVAAPRYAALLERLQAMGLNTQRLEKTRHTDLPLR